MLSPDKAKAPSAATLGPSGNNTDDAKHITQPDLTEARRLFDLGFRLCKLKPNSKRPEGDGWNTHAVKKFDETATGYGVLLAANELCSVDPDNAELSKRMLKGLGFDLEALLDAGVRTLSTRPGSGGRSAFKAVESLRWERFAFKGVGTVLELRAHSANLQDVVPGLICTDKSGELRTQSYASNRRLDDVPDLPADFLAWWQRMSTDLEFKREQQRKAGEILGIAPQLAVSSGDGKTLAFKSAMRSAFNQVHGVEDILQRHGYEQSVDGRFSPPTATGAPGVRKIAGKDDLWQSDHASDPLAGTFDAWTAFVVLDHEGNQEAAEKAARAVYEAAESKMFDYCTDVSDLLGETGTTDKKRPKFELIQAAQFAAGSPPSWIIKGVLPAAELAMVYGESGSGKSFFALDLVAAVARGVDWRGCRVRQGAVVYVAAEGAGGFRKRLAAYGRQKGIDLATLPLWVLASAPNLLTDDDKALAEAIELAGGASVVVVDTLAQTTPGANENAGEDMSPALNRCKRLHDATGALVALIHHAGKDASKGARGWSGIRAALDAQIEVLRTPGGRMARVTKQKDGDDQGAWGFELDVVAIGTDEDGDVIDSCAIRETEVPATGRTDPRRHAGKWERLVIDVVSEMALGQSEGIEVEHVLAEVLRRGPAAEEGKRDTRKQRVKAALLSLCEGGDALYSMEDGCLSVL